MTNTEKNHENSLEEKLYRSYSDRQLVDVASDFKYSNLFNKIYQIFLPGIKDSEKDIAKKILEERGVDYKQRQINKYEAGKRAKRIYFNELKRELLKPIKALYENFATLLSLGYQSTQNSMNYSGIKENKIK